MTSSTEVIQYIPIALLTPHPDNPRIVLREDVIEAIVTQLKERGVFHERYAPLVRPVEGGYQVISGHHRVEAARRAAILTVPCWTVDLDDEEAFFQVLLANNQGELSPLERGLHACTGLQTYSRNGANVKKYADRVGATTGYISQIRQAANVYRGIQERFSQLKLSQLNNKAQHLYAIHKAPKETWTQLAQALLDHAWSVKDTEKIVKRVKELVTARPAWWDLDMAPLVATAITSDVKSQISTFNCINEIEKGLSSVTIYHHQQTDEVRTINGRDHRKWEPVPETYDQRHIFRSRITALTTFPDSQQVRNIHHTILTFVDRHVSATEQWHPILTDAEHEAQLQRDRAMAAAVRRERYTPTLYQTDVLDGLHRLTSNSVDLIVVDPPYNMGKANWDEFGSGEEFARWAVPWLQECYRVLKDSGSLYLFGLFPMLRYVSMELERIGFQYRDDIIWDTIQGAGGGLWVNRKEMILFYSKTDAYYRNPEAVTVERHEAHIREYKGKEYRFKNVSNVWRIPCVDDQDAERTSHPTQKPVAVIARIIGASSPHDGLVLDPFMGSGTTGVAAMHLERRCIGIEREPHYSALARGRFEQTTIGEALG